MAQTEFGAASLHIALKDGEIIVNHGTEDAVLLKGPLPEGGWDKLCESILDIAPEAVGHMRDNRR